MATHREKGLAATDVCDDPDCYGCRLRGKGIRLSNAITSSQTKNMRPTPFAPPTQNAKIITEDRPGGFKMPFLKPDGSPLRAKEFREKRATVENTIQRIRTPKGP